MNRLSAIATAGLVLAAAAGTASAQEQGAAHVAAVRVLADALTAEDQAAFDAAFSEQVEGMQPADLWQGATNLVGRYGAIEDVAFGSMDEASGAASVTLKLAEAVREVVVRLDEKGKIRELAYSAPQQQP